MTQSDNSEAQSSNNREPHPEMSELYISIGKLEERLSSVPSPSRLFWSSFGGAGAVAALVLALVTVWLPRELDTVKTNASVQFEAQAKTLAEISSNLTTLNASVETANKQLQSLSSSVATAVLSQRSQVARFEAMQKFVDTTAAKDSLYYAAYRGDTKAMAETIFNLPELQRSQLFSIMAVSVLQDTLNKAQAR